MLRKLPSRACDPGRAGWRPSQWVPVCSEDGRGAPSSDGVPTRDSGRHTWPGTRASGADTEFLHQLSERPQEAVGGVMEKEHRISFWGMTFVPDSRWGLSRAIRRCTGAFRKNVNFAHFGYRCMSLLTAHVGGQGRPPRHRPACVCLWASDQWGPGPAVEWSAPAFPAHPCLSWPPPLLP